MLILWRLARRGFRYKKLLAVAWISLLGASALQLTIPWLFGEAVTHFVGEAEIGILLPLAIAILVLSALNGMFSYGQTYMSENVAARVSFDLRNDLLNKLQGLSFAFYDDHRTGDLMSNLTYDVDSTRHFISFGLVRSFQLLLLMLGVTPLLLIVNWQLGLISFAVIPIILFTTLKISRRLRLVWLSVRRRMGEMTTVLQEALVGMRVVKAFGAEEYEKERFHAYAYEVSEETYAADRLRIANSSFLTFMYTITTGAILWFGGRLVIDAQLNPGELTKFLMYLGLLIMPVRMLGMAVNTFTRAMSSGEKIFELLDYQSPVENSMGAVAIRDTKGIVKFDNVSFSYNEFAPALTEIDFEAAEGQKIALLGAPGSGKTTLVNMLPRFYDPTEGAVTLDGKDLRTITLDSLRRNVGIVFQDVFLFHTTIRENIAYGSPGVTFEQIENAAKMACLHDFIISQPEGYETIVGERGVTLSGGQRQRLSIARTLLLNPKILVLDDSTSSVDVESEHLIKTALKTVMENRTTFIIAHRVSSVQEANLILVMDEGHIVERGTHDELIANDGFYRKIYELQLVPSEEVFLEASIDHEV